MQRFIVVIVTVLASLEMVNPKVPPQNLTKLDGFFRQRLQQHLHQYYLQRMRNITQEVYDRAYTFASLNNLSHLDTFTENGTLHLYTFTKELSNFTVKLVTTMVLELTWDLENVTAQSVYNDLNGHCYEYLEQPIVDLNQNITNTTCVKTRLREMVTMKAKQAIKVGIQKMSLDCDQQQLDLCRSVHRKCTRAYEKQIGQLLTNYVQHVNALKSVPEQSPLDILQNEVVFITEPLLLLIESVEDFLWYLMWYKEKAYVIKPFAFENFIRALTHTKVVDFIRGRTTSQDDSTWGIIGSHTGSVRGICSHFKEKYSAVSYAYYYYLQFCYRLTMGQSYSEFLRCDLKGSTADTLTWSTAPSLYFHSQCLCVLSNGFNCGVETPDGGNNTLFYCLSVLLGDFRKQVSFRPAVTYLDYAFQARVPVCIFSEFLSTSFSKKCSKYQVSEGFNLALSMQCYFKTLTNKNLNCSETLIIDPHNYASLCGATFFMQSVVCEEDDGGDEFSVSYYVPGDSTLVMFLTYGDIVMRVLTVVTYLACRQLRNLPGKLLSCYLITVVVRLLVVQVTLADMTLAVRLDVATDLASTFWLSAYLHFLTVSIRDLRPPDSLSRDEARMVLFRYSMFGWFLPACLSAAFFCLDEAIESRVTIGQLLFLICNYVALFANIYMFCKNLKFYFDVKKDARKIKKNVKKRTVMAALVNFAIKTSVLSGAGISFRLILTQIQGLADLLGYYHAVGTIQGLLLFLLYGCNHEARTFWHCIFRSLITGCIRLCRNTLTRRNLLELAENPVAESL